MVCDIIDFRCVIVNEIVGSATLTIVLAIVAYMILATRLNFGFPTTLLIGVIGILILGLAISSFSAIIATITIIIALLIAFIFQKLIKN